MYKITMKIKTPICFIDRPLFDAIIAYAFAREYLGNRFKQGVNLSPEELIDFEAMPVKKHPDGYFYASQMYYERDVEYQGSWKKRWANEYDNIADFGKQKRKVRINAGQYKSYDMPINLHHIPEVWFYFESDNVPEVRRLLNKWIFGVGKKISQGYGEIESYEIDETGFAFNQEVCRPIPVNEKEFVEIMTKGKKNVSVKYTGYKPPYWLPANQTNCIVPQINA